MAHIEGTEGCYYILGVRERAPSLGSRIHFCLEMRIIKEKEAISLWLRKQRKRGRGRRRRGCAAH